ncbi:MAG TPA: tRNA pseudouridine(55) synthase TruB [Burkholderiaceae bacterium]|nr:tRNA pseudouridine(55) synthase TruB [Burkholderiaceae bacterium]
MIVQVAKVPRDPIDGVLMLDKPLGLSSNDALMRARRLLNARKAGHGGTLDPLATGLLPLLFGEATKFAHDLLAADKVYLAELALGVATDSGDAEGRVLSRAPVTCDEPALRAALARFVGDIEQVPPMHSALKRAGRPLYEYARAGIEVERAARPVVIRSIDLLACEGERATIRVACGKGTYIRTLAADIGAALGCGAHLASLRRERVGALRLIDAIGLDELEALTPPERLARLRPLDALLADMPVQSLDDTLAARFLNGQRLRLDADSTSPHAGHRVRVYHQARLLGIATLVDGRLAPQRLIAAT